MAESTSGWIKGAAWVLGIVTPLFVSGMVAYNSSVITHVQREHDDLTERVIVLEGLVSGLIQSTAKALQHVELHTAEKNHWIQRIEENSRSITALSKDSTARPDAYTGTMAREDHAIARADRNTLRSDLRGIENRVDNLEKCCLSSKP